MPVGEIASEVLGRVFRFIGNAFLEVVFELFVRGPGYLLCKPFKKDVDPDGGLAALVGIAFWVAIGVGAWLLYQQVSETVAVDKCLDSGGAFDHQLRKCVTE
jgi:hypothetical protein